MSQQLFGQKVHQIKMGCYSAWQKPLLDLGINELYIFHGTKPDIVPTIQE